MSREKITWEINFFPILLIIFLIGSMIYAIVDNVSNKMYKDGPNILEVTQEVKDLRKMICPSVTANKTEGE